MGTIKDITGNRYGKLVVISFAGLKNNRIGMWECKCDCGNTAVVTTNNLNSGNTSSCGCLKSEHPNHKTHGMRQTKIYKCWCLMKSRCNNPNYEHYECYGGRGIKVCKEWDYDFIKFYEYVSSLPHYGEKGYTLDRIDVNGNYEPNNVRWASKITQANNCRTNVYYDYNGESHTLSDWARIFNINPHTLNSRVRIYKWSIEKALGTPIKNRSNKEAV